MWTNPIFSPGSICTHKLRDRVQTRIAHSWRQTQCAVFCNIRSPGWGDIRISRGGYLKCNTSLDIMVQKVWGWTWTSELLANSPSNCAQEFDRHTLEPIGLIWIRGLRSFRGPAKSVFSLFRELGTCQYLSLLLGPEPSGRGLVRPTLGTSS